MSHPNRIGGRFYYGWVIVAISFLTLLVVFGIRLSFSVFFVALIDEFGWGRADTAFIFSASMITFALASTPAGIALDRWGARRVFGVGVLVLGAGLLLSGMITGLWQLVLAYGVVASLGITILGLGLQASLVSRWFRSRRGLAIGLAFAGTGIGSLLLTPGVEFVIAAWDWRIAYWALAALAFLGFPVNALLLRSNPAEMGLRPDGETDLEAESARRDPVGDWTLGAAARAPAFWLLMLAGLLAIGPVRMLTVHQLAAITDAGFPRSEAAALVGLGGAVTAGSFILFGALSDRIGRGRAYVLGAVCLVAAIALLNGLRRPEQVAFLWGYVLLFGLGEGSRASLVTATASDLFPGRAVGAVNGAVGSMFGLGAAFFPWLAGWIFDRLGSYTLALQIAASAILISALALWAVNRKSAD